ncbi:ecdysone oxidase-like [Anticarsia gemmatalis]|uniref:ecdysone oxidase-like n=1 Tax=Anticarsia gemmatalis TaxID=129554 RepID=UPI003F76D302
MNSTTAVLGIKKIQEAFKILTLLQMTAFLWPQQANVQDGASFDFIIVGAGTAGSVIANRLTEIEGATVLIIEAGGDPPVESVLPGLFPFLKKSDFDWDYYTENDNYSQQFHKNYGVELTRGKMLGGSSSMNFLAYTRGHYKVFDEWARITNDSSWNWENVLPYFMKSEKLVDPVVLNSADSIFHGTEGNIKVTKYYNEEAVKYLEAFAEIGNNILLDTNGDCPLGYTESMLTMSEGIRQSSAYSFLHTIKDRPNLFVLKKTLVTRIIFDEFKNAVGIEAILEDNTTVQFKADKEVIISAGTINTPQVLMLSGVGPKEHLEDMGIDVISKVPVGQRLQDHIFVLMNHAMGNATPAKPMDPREYPISLITGYATINESQDYPDYQTLNLLLKEPSNILNFCSFYFSYIDEICDALYEGSIGREIKLTFVVLLSPESRGKILLRSSNPKDQPKIYTGFYSNDTDLENHAKYLEHFMRIHESELFNETGAELIVPEVCCCGDIYDHEYWKCYALCMMMSGYHYTGSCSMGTVVDSRLNVYGVQRLRVADASVMPKIPGANTNAATVMVGEKAADMIKEDYF